MYTVVSPRLRNATACVGVGGDKEVKFSAGWKDPKISWLDLT